MRGTPIIISGPSGVGKGTVIQEIIKRHDEIVLSVSMTTRIPRPGEQEGIAYYFVSREQFEEHIRNGDLLEWAKVYENYYGTPKAPLEREFAAGHDVIIEIDVQGAASARMHYPDGLFIYMYPPSLEVLKERLYSRSKGDGDDLERRFSLARSEMRFAGLFEYAVINDDLWQAVREVETIIEADRSRRARQSSLLGTRGLGEA